MGLSGSVAGLWLVQVQVDPRRFDKARQAAQHIDSTITTDNHSLSINVALDVHWYKGTKGLGYKSPLQMKETREDEEHEEAMFIHNNQKDDFSDCLNQPIILPLINY